ncbi:hypothetical protein OEZ86_010800 [Tetradesmus obliquus]|nr:hypothetical protein OEZ86_010800 [Tetradesmus obliquus]
MGRRRRWKTKGLSAPIISTDADPVTRSIALHGSRVAIAAGRRWRVVDVSSQAEVHSDTTHEGAVRGIQFSTDGQYVLTCGDDKTARSWKAADWSCLRVLKSSKKACACAFSQDGGHLFFADRFGDVLVAATTPAAAAAVAAAAAAANTDAAAAEAEEPALLLGHLQAIITSLASGLVSSTGQQLLVSTDRDGKVRASVLPADPTKGSYEIHNYCLGHTNFVTCSAAVPAAAAVAAGSSSLLVTGGAAVEGQQEVQLLQLQQGADSAASLQLLQKLAFEDVANPAAVAFDGEGRLWVVGGVLLLDTESAHVGVAAREAAGGHFTPVTQQLLPGSLRGFLEGRVEAEEAGQAGQAAGSYYHEGFKRKVYTQETLAERKKVRTDFREGERLKAMFAAQDKQQQPDSTPEGEAPQH